MALPSSEALRRRPCPSTALGSRGTCRALTTLSTQTIPPRARLPLGESWRVWQGTAPLSPYFTSAPKSSLHSLPHKGPASATFPPTEPHSSLIPHQNQIPQLLRASDSPVLMCEAGIGESDSRSRSRGVLIWQRRERMLTKRRRRCRRPARGTCSPGRLCARSAPQLLSWDLRPPRRAGGMHVYLLGADVMSELMTIYLSWFSPRSNAFGGGGRPRARERIVKETDNVHWKF